ncbi:hypothetical protein [Streptomyces sp. NPDC048659]|uniref:hypothetical protein n=1 Tax=Streptomyces sp. NPDC048659 TaxID=3155489 RepID=UPI003440F16B
MPPKRFVIPAATATAAAAALTAYLLWPAPQPGQTGQSALCFGSLTPRTAALIDDGQGGAVSAAEREKKGEGDHAVFRMCLLQRATAASDGTPRQVYSLIVQDSRTPVTTRAGATPLPAGTTGWALPDAAEAQLPPGCATRMGSTAPYITVTVSAPSQAAGKSPVDRATAIGNVSRVVTESAGNLARLAGC